MNKCIARPYGDPGDQKGLFENRRRRTNEKQGKINGITVPKKALRTTLDFNNRYSTLVAVVNGTEARKPGNIMRTPTCRRHWNYRTSSGTSTCCRWRGKMELVQEDERVPMEI